MSQKAKRSGVAVEDKVRTDSPVKDMKKKIAANAEKELASSEKTLEQKSASPAPTNQKPAVPANQSNGKSAQKEQEKAKDGGKTEKDKQKTTAASADSKIEEAAKQNGSEKQTNSAEKQKNGADKQKIGADKQTNGADKQKNSADKQPNTTEKEKQPVQTLNGSRTDEVTGTNGPKDPKTIAVSEPVSEDDVLPELAYHVSDEEQVEDAVKEKSKSDTKVLKMREEYSPGPMKLRSVPAEHVEDKQEEEAEKERGETSTRRDTNFSKSRIKVSPYRRSTRLHDSIIANYTGNNTTMEMDISATESTSQPDKSDASLVSRSIRGRRSYKQLGEYVPSPRPKNINVTSSRPTVHVVGRKRKTVDEQEVVESAELPAASPEPAPVKRPRLLQRVVSPLAALVRRRAVPSSTPLPARLSRSSQIVGINTDLPLHGDVDLEPETLPLPTEDGLKTGPAADSVVEPAVETAAEAREAHRQKCSVM